ncbi:MAG: hypothetical protein HYW78_03785 [Parcubacteria group bacterium]|nr:hypothetical protein [Parcubacteria group bacterium]
MVKYFATRNEKISGLRVRAIEATCCHVSDPSSPDGFRHIDIPAGAIGTLTGDIVVFFEGADEEACKKFATDAKRVKKTLRSPDIFLKIKSKSYWERTKELTGDALLASRVSLTVLWDKIYEFEPDTKNCGSYIPWLELVSKKKSKK